jgi:hypothetical protein
VRLTSHVWNAFVCQTPRSAHDHATQVSKNLELSSSLDFFFLKSPELTIISKIKQPPNNVLNQWSVVISNF